MTSHSCGRPCGPAWRTSPTSPQSGRPPTARRACGWLGAGARSAWTGAACARLAQHWSPDHVVMDLRMPIMDGIEATRRITAMPGTSPPQVLIMTTFDLDEHIINALRAGASGFLVKDSPPEEFIHAVRVIAAGQAMLAPSITRRLLDLRGRPVRPGP